MSVCVCVCVCDSGEEGYRYHKSERPVRDVSSVDGQSSLSLATVLVHRSPLETQIYSFEL
jgi:hypothetical protein